MPYKDDLKFECEICGKDFSKEDRYCKPCLENGYESEIIAYCSSCNELTQHEETYDRVDEAYYLACVDCDDRFLMY